MSYCSHAHAHSLLFTHTYPPLSTFLSGSPFLSGIGAAASRFYLLFQQHSNANIAQRAGLLTSKSGKGWSTITHFGKRTLVVLPDTRSERSKETILSSDTYDMLEKEIRRQLLPTTRHLVIVLGTPLVYPALTLFEASLDKLGDKLSRGSVIGKIFGKCKAFENVLGQFGPELLDDLVRERIYVFSRTYIIVTFIFILTLSLISPTLLGRLVGLHNPHRREETFGRAVADTCYPAQCPCHLCWWRRRFFFFFCLIVLRI